MTGMDLLTVLQELILTGKCLHHRTITNMTKTSTPLTEGKKRDETLLELPGTSNLHVTAGILNFNLCAGVNTMRINSKNSVTEPARQGYCTFTKSGSDVFLQYR
jgi:hypothetical protein